MILMMADRVAPERRNFSAPFSAVLYGGADKEKSMSSYSELLKHPNWQKKRLEIMNERGFQCELCGSKDSMLHVHHKKYNNGKKPWEYESENFMVLCEHCHEAVHKAKPKLRELIGMLSTEQVAEALCVLSGYFGDDYAVGIPDEIYNANHYEAGSLAGVAVNNFGAVEINSLNKFLTDCSEQISSDLEVIRNEQSKKH